MSDPIEWLCLNAPGFSELQENERAAIMHFVLLWSLFEAEALDTTASAKRIRTLTDRWAQHGSVETPAFAGSLKYFQDRCAGAYSPEAYSDSLSLRKNDDRDVVMSVLKRENTNQGDCVTALFIVIYRLRNNLFHGAKWSSQLRNQLDNFTHANNALMSAIRLQRSMPQ